jgi:cytochrome P450
MGLQSPCTSPFPLAYGITSHPGSPALSLFPSLGPPLTAHAAEYRDVPSLHYIFATLYESLRLRDLVMTLPKLAQQDTVLPYTTWTSSGEVIQKTHPVKAGSHIIIDSPACQRNPFHWNHPETFDPTRFIRPDGTFSSGGAHSGVDGDGNKVVFTGFSIGTRQCIGKRFAEIEMVAFIAFMVKNYTWKPLPKFQGETRESIEKRMLDATEELSFTPSDFGLDFARRA